MTEKPKSQTASRAFVWIVIILGTIMLGTGLTQWHPQQPLKGAFLTLLAFIASGLRLNLPQIVGAMSVNFVFILIGIVELSLAETLLMGCAGTAIQVLVHRHQKQVPVPAYFHIANTALSVSIANQVFSAPWVSSRSSVMALALAATVLYAMNTFPVAVIVALERRKSLAWVWRECNFRTFPYYIAGACVAAVFHFSGELLGADSPLLLLPIAFLIYCSYHSYTGRIQNQRDQYEDMAAVHLRTVEALALAIEAKDMTAHDHLQRLQIYCTELAKSLNLSFDQIEALRAAAVLHDIGKLAVPEHILSKPGRLSREEFEKMKIHPVVGAEILERVNFPYPVAEIVRYHHEKWNGGGYPSGLKGEAIPIGARILAVVDCFDALISDRPYRSAMPIDQALNRIAAESGVSLDPAIVRLLQERCAELEEKLRLQSSANSTPRYRIETAGEALFPQKPAEDSTPPPDAGKPAYLDKIAAARQEAQVLMELTQELGNSLHLDETLSTLSTGLRRLIPFESFVIYMVRDDTLIPRYASGECTSLFLSRHIPIGQGIAGWVAQHKKAILNGNPNLEMGATSESMRSLLLNSALAVPVTATQDGAVVGVLMLCRRNYDAFHKDNLRVLLAITAKLGTVIENALKFEQVAASASTDFLTGLPNARALNNQLESEMSRCRRLGGKLTVLVTDLDGFKEVNDRFGHLEGNNVLRAVAKALRESCREYDYVARMGGDEFVILLPGLAEDDLILKIAQLNRAVIEAGKAVVPGSNLSLSVGQARFPTDGDEPERLLAEADQRMYQAKTLRKLKTGRNGPRGYDFDWLETTLPQ